MSAGVEHPGSPRDSPRIAFLPRSSVGRWAVGLSTAFFPLVFAASVVPRGAAFGIAFGVSGGVAAVVAIIRDRERAHTVFAALLPAAIAVAFVLAELITGNP